MGEIKKIGEEYYIEFYARGLLYQQKAGKDPEAARCLLEDVEGKILKGEMSIVVRDVDVDIFCQDFLKNCLKIHTPRTVKRFEDLIEHFSHFLKKEYPAVNKLSQITPAIADHYKQSLRETQYLPGRNLGEKIVCFSFMLLKDLFEFGIKLGYINDNPTTHVHLKLRARPSALPELEGQARDKFVELIEQKYAQLGRNFNLYKLAGEIREKLIENGLKGPCSYGTMCHTFASYVVQKKVGLTGLYQLLGFSDVARTSIYLSLFLQE